MMFFLVVQRPWQKLILFVIYRKKINWTFFDKSALMDCGMRNSAGLQKYLIYQAHSKFYLPMYVY